MGKMNRLVGGLPLQMSGPSFSGTNLVSRILHQLKSYVPVGLLLLICLSLAPVQQFIGSKSFLSAQIGPDVDITKELPSPQRFAQLCQTDPVQSLEAALSRYQKEIDEYTCTMIKRERIKNKLRNEEEIRCWFREKPFSVLMEWVKGADRADASLFVQGEHDNKLLIRPTGLAYQGLRILGKYYADRTTNDPEVLDASRFTVYEFGIGKGMERTFTAWKAAQERGNFNIEYLGEQVIPEVGNRPCYVIKRHCNPPEEEGLTDITIMLDKETWLQVGSILKKQDDLIGYYYFKDINFKPPFSANQFHPEILKK
jgi:hypothetical protein